MSKNAVFYFIKGNFDYTYSQFKYLADSGEDVFIFTTTLNTISREKYVGAKEIFEINLNDYKYDFVELNSLSGNKYNVIKKVWEKNSSTFQKYAHIYFIEPTFRYSQNLKDLFNELNNDNADFLSTYIQNLTTSNIVWGWYTKFKRLYDEDNYENVLKCYDGGFTRISFKALNFLMNSNDELLKYFIDLSFPTMLYNNGFTIKSLSKNETDKEFLKYDFCNSQTYYFNTSHKKITEIQSSEKKIYNTYKQFDDVSDIINHKIPNPDITIILPIYNEERVIKTAIESVLNQEDFTNFELWCIDDGSTDGTKDILNEYANHPNVVVIKRQHKGLVSVLNFGVENATGKYIVRFDADDEMLPNRLRHQFDYMESHPECDILSSSVKLKHNNEYYNMGDWEVTLESLSTSNRLFHPAIIMRSSSIKKLPFLYEEYYEGAEDYKLWVTAKLHGLRLFNDSVPVIIYGTTRSAANLKQAENAKRIQQICHQVLNGIEFDEKREMTAIIGFRNEYDEIEKTVACIRATTKNMPIVLVNDASNDDFDYEFVAKKYHCDYVHNTTPSGVAGARIDAVKRVKTKYFIILDGHMRMYEQDWDLRALEIMKQYGDENVYFGRTSVISKTGRNQSTNETAKTVNATFGSCLKGDQFTLTPAWINTPSDVNFNKEDNVIPVPILLGADYMMSVDFWNKIGGLEGLKSWGQDETLLSLKTWLAGSKVYLIQDMIFGHVYRNVRPYNSVAIDMNSNYIYCNYLFSRTEQEFKELNFLLEQHLGHGWYMKAFESFMKRFDEAKRFKEHFYKNIAKQTMDWFWEFNYNADPKQIQEYYDSRDKILLKMPK